MKYKPRYRIIMSELIAKIRKLLFISRLCEYFVYDYNQQNIPNMNASCARLTIHQSNQEQLAVGHLL